MSITAHCLVKNEDRFVWYAIMSVIDIVDRVLVYDTASTDQTIDVIRTINNPKLVLRQHGAVDLASHTRLRQQMLEETETDWFLILDGDEVWPFRQLQNVLSSLDSLSHQVVGVGVNFLPCVGDIYHYRPKGPYNLFELTQANTSVRFFRNHSGLHWSGDYGQDILLDSESRNIFTNRAFFVFRPEYYLHMTHLRRSSQASSQVWLRSQKQISTYSRWDFQRMPDDVEMPEVLFYSHPEIVPDVTCSLSRSRSVLHAFYSLPFWVYRSVTMRMGRLA